MPPISAASGKTSYDAVAKSFHWLIALAIIGMLALGWTMGDRDIVTDGSLRLALFKWHKSIGITILALSLLRLLWRLANPPPPYPATMARWEKAAAHVTHFSLYALMIGMPLTGWAMVSASPFGTLLYGLVPLPRLPGMADNHDLGKLANQMHGAAAYILAALLVLHLAAALKHHFISRDAILTRMAPRLLNPLLNKLRGQA